MIQTLTLEEILNGKLAASCLDHANVKMADASFESAVITHKLEDRYFITCKLGLADGFRTREAVAREVKTVYYRKFDGLIQSYDWSAFF